MVPDEVEVDAMGGVIVAADSFRQVELQLRVQSIAADAGREDELPGQCEGRAFAVIFKKSPLRAQLHVTAAAAVGVADVMRRLKLKLHVVDQTILNLRLKRRA